MCHFIFYTNARTHTFTKRRHTHTHKQTCINMQIPVERLIFFSLFIHIVKNFYNSVHDMYDKIQKRNKKKKIFSYLVTCAPQDEKKKTKRSNT